MSNQLKEVESYIDKILEKEQLQEKLKLQSVEQGSKVDKVQNDFKNKIKKWIDYDNQIKESNLALNEIKHRKKEVEEELKSYMTSNEIAIVKVSNMKIQRKITKKHPPLNKGTLSKCISDVIGSSQADKVVEHIYEWRKNNPTGETEKLQKLKG